MKPARKALFLIGLPAMALACDEGDGPLGPPLIAEISLTVGDCSGLQTGETCQLEASAHSADGTIIEDSTLYWRSGDITVATVNFQGRVTGTREGSATIFVQAIPGINACERSGVVCASATVVVTDPPEEPEPRP
ncbi:MAG: Ig-like domain-containing protein [Gemmatimonadota bacterium]